MFLSKGGVNIFNAAKRSTVFVAFQVQGDPKLRLFIRYAWRWENRNFGYFSLVLVKGNARLDYVCFSSVQRPEFWVVYHQVFLLRGVKLTVLSLSAGARGVPVQGGDVKYEPDQILSEFSGEKKTCFPPCLSFSLAGKCWVIKIWIPITSTSIKYR